MKVDKRFVSSELRAESQGDEMVLTGYAAKFNTESEDLGGFREIVMPGAFSRMIREKQDVRALVNHDPNLVLGRTKNGTLNLEEDATGLKFRCVLPSTQAARDAFALVKRGDVTGCSFAFIAKDQSWEDKRSENGDLYAVRRLMDVDMMDVSPVVTYPAYNATEVSTEARAGLKAQVSKRQELGGMHGDNDSYQDLLEDICEALCEQFGETKWGGPKYWQVETYDDHVIVQDSDDMECFYSIPYTIGANEEITFGEMTKMNLQYVPAVRSSFGTLFHLAYHASKRGSENQPPASGVVDNPNPATAKLRDEWLKFFNDKYDELMKKGGKGYAVKEAIGMAVAYANEQVQPQTEVTSEVSGQKKNPTNDPYEIVETIRAIANEIELRIYGSVSEVPNYVPEDKKAQWKEVWNSAYKKAKKDGKSKDDAEAGAFAQANAVAGPKSKKKRSDDVTKLCEKLLKSEEKAVKEYTDAITSAQDAGDADAADMFKHILGEEQDHIKLLNAEMGEPGEESDEERDHTDEVSDPDSPDYDPDDPDYEPDWASLRDKQDDAEGDEAARAGKKTKKIAGKNLTSDKFAYVGDPQDPSTWKLPIHDEGHARNALARFGQTKGIPADKKDSVWKKIVAAAKKFGIEVSKEDSLRSGMPHNIVQAIFAPVDDEAILESLRAKVRMIEIDLD